LKHELIAGLLLFISTILYHIKWGLGTRDWGLGKEAVSNGRRKPLAEHAKAQRGGRRENKKTCRSPKLPFFDTAIFQKCQIKPIFAKNEELRAMSK